MRNSNFRKIFALSLLVGMVFVAHMNCANARVILKCREQWMNNDSQVVNTTPCKTRITDERGAFFAVIDGKPYFHVTVRESFVSSSWRGRFDTENITENRNFWSVAGIVQLEKFRTWTRAGHTAPRYATDGQHVFNEWKLIASADPESFEVLNAQLTASQNEDEPTSDVMEWSRDKRNLYYQAKAIPHANPYSVRRVSEKLIVSNGYVFEIDFDEVKERNDMDATLHGLNWAYSVDKKGVYFLGELIKDADPHSFVIMQPVCPVPGHPMLRCAPPGQFEKSRKANGFSNFTSPSSAGVFLWWGKDKNYVYKNNERFTTRRGNTRVPVDSEGIQFFLLPGGYGNESDHVYMIDRTNLYHETFGVISSINSLPYAGTISGPLENGDLRDDKGRFNPDFLERH